MSGICLPIESDTGITLMKCKAGIIAHTILTSWLKFLLFGCHKYLLLCRLWPNKNTISIKCLLAIVLFTVNEHIWKWCFAKMKIRTNLLLKIVIFNNKNTFYKKCILLCGFNEPSYVTKTTQLWDNCEWKTKVFLW